MVTPLFMDTFWKVFQHFIVVGRTRLLDFGPFCRAVIRLNLTCGASIERTNTLHFGIMNPGVFLPQGGIPAAPSQSAGSTLAPATLNAFLLKK
jgi:hypothetical protein